ncbi:hypothetical protein NQ318_004649 [Aromia moschata]|uniref:Methyltransferase domain-containing protein n=1 Tax=Aromia moschata TaxID=1265417 RepID=A0AAV8Y876_9CUCU|nr:hypothetical protein NQ318_004649 [Aromia moschata]
MLEPKLYSKYNDLQRADNLFVLDKFLRLIKWNDHEAVLDVGIGDGSFSMTEVVSRLPKNFRKFVGCDVSESMVNFAKNTYKNPAVDFVQLDIATENIPRELEGEFHHIFSFYALHWVTKQRQAFANMYKMLKPGGDMLLTFIVRSPVYDIYRAMVQNNKWQPYMKNEVTKNVYAEYKEPEKVLEKLLRDTGFICHVCRLEKRTFVYRNMEVFKNSCIAINPVIPRLPSEEVPSYINDFIQQARNLKFVVSTDNVNNNEESVVSRHEILIVFASKPLEKK